MLQNTIMLWRIWLGPLRQHAITWANVDPDLCRHLASLGHNELDVMWRQISGSTLAQIMACCLAGPSHYLNQCWLIITEVQHICLDNLTLGITLKYWPTLWKKHKANLRDLIVATGLVTLLKIDSNRPLISLCDLKIWWMTLKNNRAPLLCCFKLCASFHSHRWIQTGVTVWKRQIWVKINYFFDRVTLKFDGRPWKIIGHLF